MRNATTSDFTAAADRRDAGEGWKSILEDTGLNYSQAWLFWARRTLENNAPHLVEPAQGDITALGRQVRQMRHGGTDVNVVASTPDGLEWVTSWGGIAVRLGVPESRVRKAYAQATNVHTEGQRKGKGGRYLKDDAGFYVEDARKVGIRWAKGSAPSYPEVGIRARLDRTHPNSLRAMLRKEGHATKGLSKAQLVDLIISIHNANTTPQQAEEENATAEA